MAIQWGKMILYGILSAIFYIAVPLILFYVLETFNIMTFSESFRTSVLIFGIIGVVISILRHAFPEDTSANRLIRFGITVYSGIFLFYIFGGFEPGRTLGTYSIDYFSPMISVEAFLGLQLIAWLFLGSTIIRGLQYLIEAIELRKKKEYRVTVKKEFRVSKIFKVFGILASLAILGYFGSIIYSGYNLDFNLHTPIAPPVYDNNGTPDPSDDSLNLTLTFDVGNAGIYAIRNVTLDAGLYTGTTDNASALPWFTKIGGSPSTYQKTFHSFTNTVNQDIVISVFPAYIVGLNTTIAELFLKLSFSTTYAGIFLALNVSLPFSWSP
ncbi:MAG: hypothetical protein ACFE78_09605, partial [Candidatus Hodarchaeota archaeon]